MNDLFWNKIFAGTFIALIVIKAGTMLSEKLVHSHSLEKPAYVIDTSLLENTTTTQNGEEIIPDIKEHLLKGDAVNGEKVFKKCLQCHTAGKGEAHKIGPNLWDVVSKPYAHEADFPYSTAFKDLKGKTWTFDDLNHFLYKPKKHIPGTKMSFVGIKDDQERADVILYLRNQSDNPLKLPEKS
jgi:cytochrome c